MRHAHVHVVVLCVLCACGTEPQKVQDHNSSRSNKTASIIVQPDGVLPMAASSAVDPSCVEVLITAGDDDADGRAAGDPVHGVDVKLGCVEAGLEATATTDSEGVASFCDLQFQKRGAFVLTATAEGTEPIETEPVLVVRAPRYLEWTSEPVAGFAGVPLRSADGSCPAVRVRAGRVMAGGVNGSSEGVAYLAGDPIPGLDVRLGRPPGGALVASSPTDTDGIARFCDLVETQAGAVSYEPWLDDDMDQGVVTNPLYTEGNGSVSPLFEGRNARSRAVVIVPYSRVLSFVRQPPDKMSTSAELPAQLCPVIRLQAASGMSLETLEVVAGGPIGGIAGAVAAGPLAGISAAQVKLTAVPDGPSLTFETDADGMLEICHLELGDLSGAYNLQVEVDGARPILSRAVSLSP